MPRQPTMGVRWVLARMPEHVRAQNQLKARRWRARFWRRAEGGGVDRLPSAMERGRPWP